MLGVASAFRARAQLQREYKRYAYAHMRFSRTPNAYRCLHKHTNEHIQLPAYA